MAIFYLRFADFSKAGPTYESILVLTVYSLDSYSKLGGLESSKLSILQFNISVNSPTGKQRPHVSHLTYISRTVRFLY